MKLKWLEVIALLSQQYVTIPKPAARKDQKKSGVDDRKRSEISGLE
jgi:hypothetical protein